MDLNNNDGQIGHSQHAGQHGNDSHHFVYSYDSRGVVCTGSSYNEVRENILLANREYQ